MGRDMKTERLYAYLYKLGGDVLLCFTLLFCFLFCFTRLVYIYLFLLLFFNFSVV